MSWRRVAAAAAALGALAALGFALVDRTSHVPRARREQHAFDGCMALTVAMSSSWTSERCPTVDELVALAHDREVQRLDPWGTPYSVRCEGGKRWELWVTSAGADRAFGTRDDIDNHMTAAAIRDVERLAR